VTQSAWCRVLAVALVAGGAVVSTSGPAEACSICRCGDPTFNALGREAYAARGWSAAVDWERFDKDEGDPAGESESQVENRFTGLLSYGVSERFTVFLRVPYSSRTLEESDGGAAGETVETSGFSDPELYGQLRLWSSQFAGGLGQRTSVSLNLGAKLPLGANEVERGGERADEHAQPGTGSTDVFGSVAVLHLLDRRSALFASAGFRRTGENDFDYRYGSTFTANAAYERKLTSRLDGVVELNFRHARRDRLDRVDDDDTGGSLLYLTPRLLTNLGGGLVLRAAAQIPVARGLNGFQKERAVLNVGLTYLFAR
jgi:outer membrane putative beta-barrel porin/alpha-amylase